jgi:hypothetical protein
MESHCHEGMMYPFVKTEKDGFLKCMVSFLVAIDGYAIPCLFFAWYRHLGVTLPSQGRAGASLIGARSASTRKAQRALDLALTGGVG